MTDYEILGLLLRKREKSLFNPGLVPRDTAICLRPSYGSLIPGSQAAGLWLPFLYRPGLYGCWFGDEVSPGVKTKKDWGIKDKRA